MKPTLQKLFLMLVAALAITAASPPEANAQMVGGSVSSTSVFFEPLSPHGDWYYTQQYGWVWTPYTAVGQWQPYRSGHWVYTSDYGYMWVSEEPWAWATYHYGRWAFLDGVWVWVPDTTWGPAWVAWSNTSSHVGWAPLPPGVGMGGYGTVNINVNIGWNHWVYVPGPQFLAVNLSPYYLPPSQVQVVYYRATPMTRYTYSRGVVLCLGPSTLYVNRWLGRPPPPVRVSYTSAPPQSYYGGNTVYVYRTPPPPSPAYRHTPPPPQRAVPTAMSGSVTRPPAPNSAYRTQPASPPVTGRTSPPPPSNAYRSPAPAAPSATTGTTRSPAPAARGYQQSGAQRAPSPAYPGNTTRTAPPPSPRGGTQKATAPSPRSGAQRAPAPSQRSGGVSRAPAPSQGKTLAPNQKRQAPTRRISR